MAVLTRITPVFVILLLLLLLIIIIRVMLLIGVSYSSLFMAEVADYAWIKKQQFSRAKISDV